MAIYFVSFHIFLRVIPAHFIFSNPLVEVFLELDADIYSFIFKYVVQGLGFVGAVMSLVVANSFKNYRLIGVDLPSNQDVIDNLNSGVFPIESSDPKVESYFHKAIARENFKATSDICVYADADVVIVDINLDVQKGTKDISLGNEYSVDLRGFKRAIQTIA